MPYINADDRPKFETQQRAPQNDGEMNYVITAEIVDYLGSIYGYADLNAVVGVLECAKLEFYRRVVAPYEDDKLRQNGDVYR